VPEYRKRFKAVFSSEPTYGGTLKAVAEYLKTLRSEDAPYDRFIKGDPEAISEQARRGFELFRGEAGCVQCHHGPMLTDNEFHALGVPENRAIFKEPKRHITFRRFLRTLGVTGYAELREDVGRYSVTKNAADRKRFKTPSLREVGRTAPYMHNGMFATLEDVLEFYTRTRKISLTVAQRGDLVAFLKTLSGKPVPPPDVKRPPYALRKLGEN